MKYWDAIGLGLVGGLILFGLWSSGLKTAATIVALAMGSAGVIYYGDLNTGLTTGFSKNSDDLEVTPNEALDWLQNEFIPNTQGHKKLNLDKTSDDNRDFFTKIQKVKEDGDKKVRYGVIGRPLNQKTTETIGYVVYCDEGWAEYSGQLYGKERKDPFKGKHSWMKTVGAKAAKMEEESKGSKTNFNIYQDGERGE